MSFFSSRSGNNQTTHEAIEAIVSDINNNIKEVNLEVEDGYGNNSIQIIVNKNKDTTSSKIPQLVSLLRSLPAQEIATYTLKWIDGNRKSLADWQECFNIWKDDLVNELDSFKEWYIEILPYENYSLSMFNLPVGSINRFLFKMLSLFEGTSSCNRDSIYKKEMIEYENKFNALLMRLPEEIEKYRIEINNTFVIKENNKYVSYNKWLKEVNQKYNTLKESGAFNYNC